MSREREKIIELMARGICPIAMANPKLHGEHQRARHFAIDALTALEAAGYAVNSQEQLFALIRDAYLRGHAWAHENIDAPWYAAKAANDYADKTTSAMIAAAKEQP